MRVSHPRPPPGEPAKVVAMTSTPVRPDPVPPAPTVRQLADATPAGRDRYVDLLRVVSIGVVVVGHWLMAGVESGPTGGLRVTNALGTLQWLQPATWLLQVMPVFFLVGGFVHLTALRALERRGGGYADFVRPRAVRLLRPLLVFLAVWVVLALLLEVTGWQAGVAAVAVRTVVQPLWFLGVYLGVVALAPLTYRWHRRSGATVPVVLALAATGVDVVRLGAGVPAAGVLNVALVWLAVHQLGFLYADGILTRGGRRTAALLAVGGLGTVVVLTVVTGAYPVSMVGLPGEPVSNMNPPTVALLAHAVWLTGVVLLLRGPASRWLDRPRVWTAVVAANGVAMTTFLWHLSALFALYAAVLAAGVPLPAVGERGWWLTRPVWLAVLAVLCGLLVAVFRGAERPAAPRPAASRPAALGAPVAALGMAAATVGVLGVAVTGLGGMLAGRQVTLVLVPMTAVGALALLAAGVALLRVVRLPG